MSTENPTSEDSTMSFDQTADSGSFEEIEQLNQAITKRESDVIAGKYELNEVIGQGGMGKIYKATQLKLNRCVAIKVMLAPDDKTATQRFEAEASVTANLTHPNTIRIFDFGVTEDGFLYLVMEHLDGINIKQYLKIKGAMPPLLAAKLTAEICGSLAEAHRKDIIHRDIKPGNIMLVESPEEGTRSKLLDFGLVKSLEGSATRTRTGVILGSPMYMSPEQIDGQHLGPQSDLYSLGLTLYNMLTDSKPFQEANLSGILAAQLFKNPTPLQEVNKSLVDYPSLIWIVNTAIEKKPENRFRSAGQMKRALDCFLQDPKSNLELIEGALYQNGQAVDDVTVFHGGSSLQGSLLASNVNDLSGTTQTLHETPAPPQKKNPLGILVLTLIGLVSIGVAYAFFQQPEGENIPEKTTIVKKITPEEKGVKKTPPIDPVATEMVLLDTIPSGASVFDENDEQLSITPFTIKIGKKKSVTLRLDGYVEQTITLSKDVPERTITLKAQPKKTNSAANSSSSNSKKKNPYSKTSPEKTKDKGKEVKKVTNPFDIKK